MMLNAVSRIDHDNDRGPQSDWLADLCAYLFGHTFLRIRTESLVELCKTSWVKDVIHTLENYRYYHEKCWKENRYSEPIVTIFRWILVV